MVRGSYDSKLSFNMDKGYILASRRLQLYFVLRNKLWFEHAIPKIQDVWSIIEHERNTGHNHRLPKSQNRKPRSNSLVENSDTNTNTNINTDINTNSGCLIDTECLQNQIIYIDTKYELVEDISGQDISGN